MQAKAFRKILATAGVVFAVLIGGCVERELLIDSNPAGATVRLNDEEIGVTPVTVGFNWYGDYKISLSKQGYETLDTHKKMDRPLHDVFPFDFFAECLWPGRIIDKYEWEFELAEKTPVSRDELIKKAQTMRETAKTIPTLEEIEKELEE